MARRKTGPGSVWGGLKARLERLSLGRVLLLVSCFRNRARTIDIRLPGTSFSQATVLLLDDEHNLEPDASAVLRGTTLTLTKQGRSATYLVELSCPRP